MFQVQRPAIGTAQRSAQLQAQDRPTTEADSGTAEADRRATETDPGVREPPG